MTVVDRPLPALLPSARDATSGSELPQVVASRALAQASALLAWGWLTIAPVVILAGPGRFDIPRLLLVVAVMAAVAGGCTAVVVRRPQALSGVTAIGLAAVAGGIAAFDVTMTEPGVPWNPAVSLMGTACLVAGLVLRARPAALAALGFALWQSAWDLGAPSSASLDGYSQMLLTAAGAVVAGRFVSRSLVRSSLQVGELVGRLLAEQRADREQGIRESSLVAARTDLHDTVLTTLSGIGAGWLRVSDPAALRAELDRDIRLIEETEAPPNDGPVDLAAALHTMAGTSLLADLDVRLDATECHVPPVVADALLLATREALVNTLKHAGVDSATVTLQEERGTIRITVRDGGRGFDPDLAPRGMGLAGITARLSEIGGWATVDSAPGTGTTVTLVLPGAASAPAPVVPQLWSQEGPRRGALWLTVVAGVSQSLSFFLQVGRYTDPAPPMAALALALAVDAVVVLTLVRRPDLPNWLAVLLLARIPAVLLLTGLPLSGCAPMGYEHFSGGGELFTVIVICLLRPRRDAIAATVLLVLAWATLAAPLYRVGEACGITAVLNSALAVGLVLAALTFVGALRRHAAIAAEVLAEEERLAAARTAERVRTAARRRLLAVVGDIVTDTLRGLVEGRLDPTDPAARRLCRRDAGLLRSYLQLAGDSDDLMTALFTRSIRLRDERIDLTVRGSLPQGSIDDDTRQAILSTVDACLARARASGWAGEGLVTVLRAGADVLVTVVLRDVPAEVTGDSIRRALPATAPAPDRAVVTEGELWITVRLPAVRIGSPGANP